MYSKFDEAYGRKRGEIGGQVSAPPLDFFLRKPNLKKEQSAIYSYRTVQLCPMVSVLYPKFILFFVIPFYLQSVPVHLANCVWHVEECSAAHIRN
jgi:hypothetical protein